MDLQVRTKGLLLYTVDVLTGVLGALSPLVASDCFVNLLDVFVVCPGTIFSGCHRHSMAMRKGQILELGCKQLAAHLKLPTADTVR